MMKISQRPISKGSSSLFPKPRHVRNLFGAKRDDPQVRAWLEKHLVKISTVQSARMLEQWGFDVEKGCFVSENSATSTSSTEVHTEMEPVPSYYEPVITPEQAPLAPIFTNFSVSSTRRPVSSPNSPVARKKSSSGTPSGRPAAVVRTCSVQQSLLGSLAVRKSNSVKSLASLSKKLDEDVGASTGRPLVSPREAKTRCEETVMM